MPENPQKGPKEQRRRRGRQHAAPAEKIEKKPEVEKKPEPPKEPEKSAYEPPGPEFYKSLKRETDEILKITEEANTKYKKKEIQSNWAKYEMPIETYEEIDEQENLGADYEALIQAPLSVGGHFQFKHEKSWDTRTDSSVYDKYFEINMENLNLALNTIPFHERNNIELTVFTESDLQSMNHRANKYKQKYFNDKNFTTPELEAQQKILNLLSSNDKYQTEHTDEKNVNSNEDTSNDKLKQLKDINLEQFEPEHDGSSTISDSKLEEEKASSVSELIVKNDLQEAAKACESDTKNVEAQDTHTKQNKIIDTDFEEIEKELQNKIAKLNEPITESKEIVSKMNESEPKVIVQKEDTKVANSPKKEEPPKVVENVQKEVSKNPIIESPEDLEKWLDDFLDG